MIAEQSPERDVIVQRKAPKAPKEYPFKIQNVNEAVNTAGATAQKPRHGKKKSGGTAQKEIKVIDFIAEQKGKTGAEQASPSFDLLNKGYDTDLQRQQSNKASFKDSESRDDRSSQISLVTDKDTIRAPVAASNSSVVGLHGLTGSQAASSSKFGPAIPSSQTGTSMQPRKSILPQMDYTNKYVKRHQQSRIDSTDKEGSQKNHNYSIVSSQKSFQGQGSTIHGGDYVDHDEVPQGISNRIGPKALSQMEQISCFD